MRISAKRRLASAGLYIVLALFSVSVGILFGYFVDLTIVALTTIGFSFHTASMLAFSLIGQLFVMTWFYRYRSKLRRESIERKVRSAEAKICDCIESASEEQKTALLAIRAELAKDAY